MFSSLDHAHWAHISLRCINDTKAFASCSLEIYPMGRHRPFLNSSGIIKSCKICGEGKKKHCKRPNSSFIVSTTKLSKSVLGTWSVTAAL